MNRLIIRCGTRLNGYIGDRLVFSSPDVISQHVLVQDLIKDGWKYIYPRIFRSDEVFS